MTLGTCDTSARMSEHREPRAFQEVACCTRYTQFGNLNLKKIGRGAGCSHVALPPTPGSQALRTCVYPVCTGYQGHSETSPQGLLGQPGVSPPAGDPHGALLGSGVHTTSHQEGAVGVQFCTQGPGVPEAGEGQASFPIPEALQARVRGRGHSPQPTPHGEGVPQPRPDEALPAGPPQQRTRPR